MKSTKKGTNETAVKSAPKSAPKAVADRPSAPRGKLINMTHASEESADKVILVPLSRLREIKGWNSRTKEASGGPDERTGFAGLVESIATDGQDTPVICRPFPKEIDAEANKAGILHIVSGHRRTAAVEAVAKRFADTEDPVVKQALATNPAARGMVKVIVRDLAEDQARALNVRENQAREDLSGPDLAFGVAAIDKAATACGRPTSAVKLAAELNVSQAYVSALLTIMAKVHPKILSAWREGTYRAPYRKLYALKDIPKADQLAQWEKELATAKAAAGERKKAGGKNSWKITAEKQAQSMGSMLGTLAKRGQLTIANGPDVDFFADNLPLLIPAVASRELSVDEIGEFASVLETAYESAYERRDKSERDVSGKKSGKNGTVAQA